MGIMTTSHITTLIGAYLCGAIPFGLIIAQNFYHVDIRKTGSGNPGATNVWRTLGKKPGIATLFLDVMKGVIPVLMAKHVDPIHDYFPVIVGLLAIVGHNWSIFLRGSGGKGVATSAGVFLALIPLQAAIAIATFLVVFFSTGHVSVGSMAGAMVLLLCTFFLKTSMFIQVTIVVAALMLIIKHVPNMKRLAQGTEPKVKFR